jgi:CheY-like chemotaxis protein
MSKRVLLVDDSQTALLMEQMVLSSQTQYQLFTARNGEEAVDAALTHLPDLILMDVVMPGMNGFEACREIRQKPQVKHIPIILVTTRGEQECVEQGFVSGCNDYITKPVNGHELVLLLRNYLGE